MSDDDVFLAFERYTGPGRPGFYTDFLGVKTRAAYFSPPPREGGGVEDYPSRGPGNFHSGPVEWAGALRAVLAAGPEFVMVELGAGWSPWSVSLAAAARQKGARRVRLVGVEGSHLHCEYSRTHYRDNGLDPDAHTLLHGVVGAADGVADFPLFTPGTGYGAAAAFAPAAAPPGRPGLRLLRAAARALKRKAPPGPPANYERVRCYSLPTILAPLPAVDLVHIDIQGEEANVVAGARAVLRDKVKRLVVGTHGRLIEERLFGELAAQGWALEAEHCCAYRQDGPRMALHADGCQVWRNTAFDAARRAEAS